MKSSLFFWCLVSFFSLSAAFAQQSAEPRKIEITRYNSFEFAQRISPDAQRVIGDVEFEHEGMTMTCDSAYLYNQSNMLEAFGNVRIINADGSVTITGDFAKYQGNIKFAEIWGDVVLVDSSATLKTQHLYYDLNTEIAYYLVGGEIFSQSNDMVSKHGHYHRNIDMFYFKTDVVLNTPEYTILTDTLDYNVLTEIAYFVGPTFIQNEKDTIYCERGWYNTNDTIALFRQNAWLKSGSTTVHADTLYYESQTGDGQAFSNITIVDTTNNVILKGQRSWFNNPTERAWLTGRALMILTGEQDSLFLHADTLRSEIDTSEFKILKAYNRVRFFSQDMQGKCDSLVLTLQDSVIHMFHAPVLWAQDNQMTGERIEIETEGQKPKRMVLINRGFIVQDDSVGFNQIKGRRIVGLFRDNELYRIDGFNDAETVYFIRDGDDVTGANKLKSTDVVILIEERKAQEVTHTGPSEGDMIPPNEFDPSELTLTGFRWVIELKPADRDDIFEWKEESEASTQRTATTIGESREGTPERSVAPPPDRGGGAGQQRTPTPMRR